MFIISGSINFILFLIVVISLFQQIESVKRVSACGRANRLHFVGIVPRKIANRDVSNEFCGGRLASQNKSVTCCTRGEDSEGDRPYFDWLLTDISTRSELDKSVQ